MLILSVLLQIGCSPKVNSVPSVGTAQLPLAEANYKVGRWVCAKACGNYSFGLRTPESGENKKGVLAVGTVIGLPTTDPDTAEALFEAMSQAPDATHLIYPRIELEVEGFAIPVINHPIFGKRCSTVRAKTLTIGQGPK